MDTEESVEIRSSDYWFKIVDFLQQNWALIDDANGSVRVRFVSDASGVFDELEFRSMNEATDALQYNGFGRLAEDERAKGFLRPPQQPFRRRAHPNGSIYSSGRFWASPVL